jgi:transposase InsO family protein
VTAEPDYTPRRGLDGRMFAKTRPMNCPWCGDLFYVFQADDAPQPPYENPEPPMVGEPGKEVIKGMRHVCDKPACWDREQAHQMRRTPCYRLAAGEYFSPGPQIDQPKVVPLKGLKMVGR